VCCVLSVAVVQSSEVFEITDTIEMASFGFTFILVAFYLLPFIEIYVRVQIY